MGQRFFKIVGVFSYAVAALALVAALGLAGVAAVTFFGSVDEEISTTDANLKRYQQTLQAEHQAIEDEAAYYDGYEYDEAEGEYEEPEWLQEVDAYVDRVCTAITTYAEATQQPEPYCDVIGSALGEESAASSADELLAFWHKIATEMEALAKQAKTMAALDENAPEYVYWINFIEWLVEEYNQHYYEELDRIQTEQLEQSTAKAGVLILASAAATAFIVFIFFTLILLLVKIEANTRKEQ